MFLKQQSKCSKRLSYTVAAVQLGNIQSFVDELVHTLLISLSSSYMYLQVKTQFFFWYQGLSFILEIESSLLQLSVQYMSTCLSFKSQEYLETSILKFSIIHRCYIIQTDLFFYNFLCPMYIRTVLRLFVLLSLLLSLSAFCVDLGRQFLIQGIVQNCSS